MGGFSGTSSNEQVLADSAVAITNTLDSVENIALTVNIPPLQANSKILVDTLFSKTGTQTVTFRERLGGIGGTAHMLVINTTLLSVNDSRVIQNRGATNSQVSASSTTSFSAATLAPTTGAIDTSIATTLVLTIQQSAASVSASEVAKLERVRVRVIY